MSNSTISFAFGRGDIWRAKSGSHLLILQVDVAKGRVYALHSSGRVVDLNKDHFDPKRPEACFFAGKWYYLVDEAREEKKPA
jgi:hypothetical protein